MLPNFFIVGAPKAGTTSLYNILRSHPDIFMSPVKEPNFFTFREIEQDKLYYKHKNVKSLKTYERLFRKTRNQKILGEASVSYLYYPDTAANIKKLIPQAKIIILLRNPIERAFSHYLMDKRLGYIRTSFEDVVFRRSGHKLLPLYYQQYIDLGFYYEQVRRYLLSFPDRQVGIYLSENLSDSGRTFRSILEFLKVDNKTVPNPDEKYNAHLIPESNLIGILYRTALVRKSVNLFFPQKWISYLRRSLFNHEPKPEIGLTTRTHLYNLYRSDIESLENLINMDLSLWHT